MTARSHSRPQEPRSPQEGTQARASQEDGSGGRLGLLKRANCQPGPVWRALAYGSDMTSQAWDQIKAKDPETVVSLEEFRADYCERIPGLTSKVAKRLRVTVPQLHMMIFKGQLKWGDLYQ